MKDSKLERLRTSKGLSRDALAQASNVPASRIGIHEQDGHGLTYREFIKVAKALEVGPAEIFDAPRQEAELIIHDVFTRLSSDEKADWLGIAQAILGEEEGSRERRE